MDNLYDLIIIGAGPAGLSAAIYAGRAEMKTVVIDREDYGGQIKITSEVVNYPGVKTTTGDDLTRIMKEQGQSFGVEFVTGDVSDIDFKNDIKEITLASGKVLKSVGVIIATGAKARSLGFEGEKEFKGRGIGNCATCDGEFFRGLDIFVIGGGFAAAEEAIYLTRYGKTVNMIVTTPEMTCSKSIIDKAQKHEKIKIHYNTDIVSVSGENILKNAKFKNNVTGETWEHNAGDSTFGVFVFIGYEPLSDVFKNQIKLDNQGYILTDENLETNIKGIYAAGDIRPKTLRQLVTSVSDGGISATNIEKYISDKKEELDLTIEFDKKEETEQENFIDDGLKEQLKPILDNFKSKVIINGILIEEGDKELLKLSKELKIFLQDLEGMHNNIEINYYKQGENIQLEESISNKMYPQIAIMDDKNEFSRASFNGVPGGHEFNSFILAMYNTAKPGQQPDKKVADRVKNFSKKADLKICVSLSCTLCPDLVTAAQFLAINNENVTAQMVDLSNYDDIKSKYSIMSVPAMIVNDEHLSFGKKSLEELLDYLEETL